MKSKKQNLQDKNIKKAKSKAKEKCNKIAEMKKTKTKTDNDQNKIFFFKKKLLFIYENWSDRIAWNYNRRTLALLIAC